MAKKYAASKTPTVICCSYMCEDIAEFYVRGTYVTMQNLCRCDGKCNNVALCETHFAVRATENKFMSNLATFDAKKIDDGDPDDESGYLPSDVQLDKLQWASPGHAAPPEDRHDDPGNDDGFDGDLDDV